LPFLIFSPISLSTSGGRRLNFSFTLLDHQSGRSMYLTSSVTASSNFSFVVS